jgi:thiamine biosynthesis lipoprotein
MFFAHWGIIDLLFIIFYLLLTVYDDKFGKDIFMNRKDRIFLEIIVGLILLTGAVYFFVSDVKESVWPAGRIEVDSGQRVVMGTFARVAAVAMDEKSANRCVEAAHAEINKVDRLMSDYKPDSEISAINRDGFKRPVKVSEATFEVLQRSVYFSKLTDGAFDVTVGPLVDLWHKAGEANSVPSEAELADARSRVGYDKLILDANDMSVKFAVEGMRLDLGAIAKGYAVDKAVEAMQAGGALGGMVDIGGDIRCFGAPPRGKEKWRVGLRDSRAVKQGEQSSGLLMVLEVTDAAVVTSGDYERFVEVGGERYSPIINPTSGKGKGELSSVTIIGKNTTSAWGRLTADVDAIATAVSVMGVEEGLALIEATPDTEAILVTSAPEYRIIKSAGADKFID